MDKINIVYGALHITMVTYMKVLNPLITVVTYTRQHNKSTRSCCCVYAFCFITGQKIIQQIKKNTNMWYFSK